MPHSASLMPSNRTRRATTARRAYAAWLAGHKRPGEVAGVERLEVVERLAHADELHGQPELVRDREHNAALRGAVELREDDAGDVHGAAEEPRLLETVL